MIRTLIIFLCFLTSYSLPGQAEAGDSKTIHYFVLEKTGRPFQIHSTETEQQGIISDVIYAIFDNSDYNIVTHALPYNRMKTIMSNRTFPNWIRYGSPDWGPGNENLSKFPVLEAHNILVSLKDKKFTYNTIEDLFGKTIILISGFQYPGLEKYIKDGKIKALRVHDFAIAYKALDYGRGVAISDFSTRMRYNLKWLNRDIKDYEVHDFSDTINNFNVYLNMDPQMPIEISNFINSRLSALKETKAIEGIIQKYTR